MTRSSTLEAVLAALLVAAGCSSEPKTHIDINLGDGGSGPLGGSGGTAVAGSGGAAPTGGASTVNTGGALSGTGGAGGSVVDDGGATPTGGASSAGGAGGTGGAGAGGAGAGGAAAKCTGCWLLADDVDWERFDAFIADGTQLVWQDYSDNIVTMGFDGSNKKTFTLPVCDYPWKGVFLFDGYVYFSQLHATTTYGIFRVPAGLAEGASCEQKYTGVDSALSVFLDAPRKTFWASAGTTSTNAVTHVVRVDYPSFAARTEITQNDAYVQAADDVALYGYSDYHVVRFDRATKQKLELNDEVGSSRVIAVDGTHVYYMFGANLKRTPKGAHTAGAGEIIPGPNQPYRIAADGNRVVYWSHGDTYFTTMPLAGGTPTQISLGAFAIRGLTWDATRWFVMTGSLDGPYKLLRLEK